MSSVLFIFIDGCKPLPRDKKCWNVVFRHNRDANSIISEIYCVFPPGLIKNSRAGKTNDTTCWFRKTFLLSNVFILDRRRCFLFFCFAPKTKTKTLAKPVMDLEKKLVNTEITKSISIIAEYIWNAWFGDFKRVVWARTLSQLAEIHTVTVSWKALVARVSAALGNFPRLTGSDE